MEFEQPKSLNQPHEQKEAKKKKSSKRTPARVPLPISEKAEQSAHKKVDLEKKPKKKKTPKEAAPKEAEAPVVEKTTEEIVERPKVSLEKQHKPGKHIEETPQLEAKDKPVSETESVVAAAKYEEEVSLHSEAEGEVFVSDRLRQPLEAGPEEPEVVGRAEAEALVPENAQESQEPTAEDQQDEDVTARPRQMRQNPQQQQQTQAGSSAAAGAAASPFLAQWRNRNADNGGNGNIPPVPPTGPPHNPDMPPAGGNIPPNNPNLPPLNPNVLPPTPNVLPITSQQVPEQVRDGASERRHLVTGLVVGALIEHVRHKRREKRMTKEHKKEVKELKKEQDATNIERQAEQHKNLREKTALEQTIDRMKKAEVSFAAVAANKTPETITAKPAAKEQSKENRVQTAEEAKKEFEERARRAVEIAREPTEDIEIPKEHRIESSSWHAIEIDKKTGKAVENASFAYGEAFHQEQHQEQLRKEVADAAEESEETRKKYKEAKASDSPTFYFPAEHQTAHEEPSRSEKLRDKGADLAEAATHIIGKIQPVDALLWVILGIIVLIILKLL